MANRSPIMSDKPHELLDHVEFCALTDPDRNSSKSQLASELIVTGSVDAVEEDETEQDKVDPLEGITDAVFTEAEDRIKACGGEANYPFDLQRKALVGKDESLSSVYTFLLFLSRYGEKAVEGVNGAKLFEDVCSHAIAAYLGCHEALAESYVFGFPRKFAPKDFVGALEDLCRVKILEGKPKAEFPDINLMKDAGLDIVAWLPFPDKRSSKLIAFGQCATGQNWWGKRHELQPQSWLNTWLSDQPQATPIKTFFIPHAVTVSEWAQLGYQAGIIFDRFRITYLAEPSISDGLRINLRDWNRAALSNDEIAAN
jgi:hypothetical protein